MILDSSVEQELAFPASATEVRRLPERESSTESMHALLWALVAFLGVFFIQALFVKYFGVNLPYWDDWTNLDLFRDYRSGTLTLSRLLSQHNEHRILIVRLAFLGLFQLFGEWDLRSEMLFSAAVVGGYAAIWTYTLRRLGTPGMIALTCCLLLVSPVQSENILWGFQIQFYTLVFGAVLAVCRIALGERIGWTMIALAAVACFVSTFSIASGLFVWGVAGLCLLVKLALSRRPLRALLADRALVVKCGVFAAAALACAILYLYNYSAPQHNNINRSSTIGIFFSAFLRALCYPILEDPGIARVLLALTLWGTIIVGLIVYVGDRHEQQSQKKLALLSGFVAFLLANAAIIAYSRGGWLATSSRYGTLFLWSSLLAIVVAADLLRRAAQSHRPLARSGVVAAALVAILVLVFHLKSAVLAVPDMAFGRDNRLRQAQTILSYLRDESPERELKGPIPFPSPDPVKKYLDDPGFRALLPQRFLAESNALPASTSGDAWSTGNKLPAAALRQQPRNWVSWSGSDAKTGRIESGPLHITQPILSVPVAGYPSRYANRLVVRALDDPDAWVAYDGPEPREKWLTWQIDVSPFVGRDVQIVAVDNATASAGWLGIGNPMQISRGALLLEAFLQHLELIIGCVVAGAVVFALLLMYRPFGLRRALFGLPRARLTAIALMVLVTSLGVYFIGGGMGIARLTPSSATASLAAGSVSLVEHMPNGYIEETSLHRTFDGVFMLTDAALEFGPFAGRPNSCFYSGATIDPRVPADPEADGVDFAAQVWADTDIVEQRISSVQRGEAVDEMIRLPDRGIFTVRLEVRHRQTTNYDWAIWQSPHIAACP